MARDGAISITRISEQLDRTFASSRLAVFVVDRHAHPPAIIYVNDAFLRLNRIGDHGMVGSPASAALGEGLDVAHFMNGQGLPSISGVINYPSAVEDSELRFLCLSRLRSHDEDGLVLGVHFAISEAHVIPDHHGEELTEHSADLRRATALAKLSALRTTAETARTIAEVRLLHGD